MGPECGGKDAYCCSRSSGETDFRIKFGVVVEEVECKEPEEGVKSVTAGVLLVRSILT
jgi:hypothetical protein